MPIRKAGYGFYRDREDSGEVRLNRVEETGMLPLGKFRCEIPDTKLMEIFNVCSSL